MRFTGTSFLWVLRLSRLVRETRFFGTGIFYLFTSLSSIINHSGVLILALKTQMQQLLIKKIAPTLKYFYWGQQEWLELLTTTRNDFWEIVRKKSVAFETTRPPWSKFSWPLCTYFPRMPKSFCQRGSIAFSSPHRHSSEPLSPPHRGHSPGQSS